MRRIFQTTATLGMAIGMAMASVVPAAQAQSNCASYGNLALKQARDNEVRKCGEKGPKWSTDLKAHIAWCATVGPPQWQAELRERAAKLASCGKG